MRRDLTMPASSFRLVLIFLSVGLGAAIAAQAARYVLVSQYDMFRDGTWYATVGDFRAVHLEASYLEHGYLRRGLLGTLLDVFGVVDVALAGWLLSLASVVVFAGFSGWVAARLPASRRGVAYMVLPVLVLGPAGIAQFVSDAARVDHVLLPLAAVAAVAGLRGRLTLSVALFVVMCLIHELSIIAFAPVLTVSNILGARDRTRIRFRHISFPFSRRSVAAFSFATAAVMAVTLVFGNSPGAVQAFSDAAGEQPRYSAMIWGENSPVHMVSWLGTASLLLVVYYIALLGLGLSYSMSLRGDARLLPAAVLSCLLLNFVGVDGGRWAALSTWTLLVAILAAELARSEAPDGRSVGRPFFVFGFILSLPVGPLGVRTPFSLLLRLIES